MHMLQFDRRVTDIGPAARLQPTIWADASASKLLSHLPLLHPASSAAATAVATAIAKASATAVAEAGNKCCPNQAQAIANSLAIDKQVRPWARV